MSSSVHINNILIVFNEDVSYKVMFKLIKQLFIALLSSSRPLITKCVSLNSKPSMTRSTLLIQILMNIIMIHSWLV